MLRDTIFLSGLPTLVASVCCGVFVYVASVRHERLATYWALAWAMLIARFCIYMWFPGPQTELSSVMAGALRVSFAGTVFAGVAALRGESFSMGRLIAIAIALTGLAHLVTTAFALPVFPGWVALIAMDALLLAAAWRLADGPMLPRFERWVTAAGLAAYAVCSTVAPRVPSGSQAFTVAIMGSWAAQLLISFGLLATFFRLSHDGEMHVRSAMEQRLAAALGEFVSVCMHCKSVRDDTAEWQPLERFVSRRSSSQLSHGLCPTCAERFYPAESIAAK